MPNYRQSQKQIPIKPKKKIDCFFGFHTPNIIIKDFNKLTNISFLEISFHRASEVCYMHCEYCDYIYDVNNLEMIGMHELCRYLTEEYFYLKKEEYFLFKKNACNQ